MPSYTVVLRPDPDEPGAILAEVPALPGCQTFGANEAEAPAMARNAIEGYLLSLKDEGRPYPPDVTTVQAVIISP